MPDWKDDSSLRYVSIRRKMTSRQTSVLGWAQRILNKYINTVFDAQVSKVMFLESCYGIFL
jgi:hypothetical protein